MGSLNLRNRLAKLIKMGTLELKYSVISCSISFFGVDGLAAFLSLSDKGYDDDRYTQQRTGRTSDR